MKFSIVVPVYNVEKHLAESMQSILQQNYSDYEVILVDDGSTDQSGSLCDLYAKENNNIKVIHKENNGQLMARIDGIKSAVGEYCLFLDADDLFVDDFFNILQNKIEQYDFPDMLIYSFFYEHENKVMEQAKLLWNGEKLYTEKNKNELYECFLTGTLLNNVWTKVIKKEVLLTGCIDYRKYSHLRCSEDRLHSMEMVTNSKRIIYMDTPLYRYRLYEGSVTRQYDYNSIEKFNISSLYNIQLEYLELWNIEMSKWKNVLDANEIRYAIYIFDKFYNNQNSYKGKRKIMEYTWIKFISESLQNNYKENPELTELQKKRWEWIVTEKKSKTKQYIWKHKRYKQIRQWKQKYFN